MSINSLEFRENMTGELEKQVVQGATVGFFEDNVLRAKFVGAKTVLIPTMDMSGLGDYDRDNGFVQGSIALTSEPFTLQQDRARSFQLDREDNDETGVANLAGEVLGEFVRTKVVPEVDAYCLSKLGGYAVSAKQTVPVDTGDALDIFNNVLGKVREEVGYDEELVAFVSTTFLHSLSASDKVSRQIVMSDFKKGEVHTRVKTLDDVPLLPVPSTRMRTAYTFMSGGEGQADGGFAPTENARLIQLIVMPKKAAALVKKGETIRSFTPEQNQKADAYKFDYRLYYDVFIKNSMKTAIWAFATAG